MFVTAGLRKETEKSERDKERARKIVYLQIEAL